MVMFGPWYLSDDTVGHLSIYDVGYQLPPRLVVMSMINKSLSKQGTENNGDVSTLP